VVRYIGKNEKIWGRKIFSGRIVVSLLSIAGELTFFVGNPFQ